MSFETKDSGERQTYGSGMSRDIQSGKPRFDLLLVDGLPYGEQFLTRFAALLERGASKYGERNWQLADSAEELARFKASGLRHMMQWQTGETDEDHAAAVAFNLMAAEYVKWKMGNATTEVSTEELEDSSSGDPSQYSSFGDGQESRPTIGGFLRGFWGGVPDDSPVQSDFVRACDNCTEVHPCKRD